MSQQNITTLQAAINSQLADNTSGDISAADVRNNLINMTDSLLFNTGSTQALTGSLTVTEGVTGSLQGTATSASYALTASYANNAFDVVIYVKNSTGAQINKGTVVRITGAVGDNALISTASYTDDNNSANTLGITKENIADGSFGYVITEGTLLGINTDSYTAGQLLYLGATGSLTGSAPLPPLHAVRLGQVLRSQLNNGSMYVRIDNGYELGELHDVRDTTTTSSYGDLLVRSGSVWTNSRQLTGSYSLTGSLNATSFTGSLLGTASYVATAQTASYVAGGNVNGAVASATDAVNSALIYTSKTDTNGEFKVLFTDNLNLDDNSDVYKENGSTFTYNPGLNRLSLSRILADNITGSLQGTATAAVSASYATTASVLLGSVTSASYAVTASLSNETIGAGDLGSIQFKGGTGPGSVEGKNTWSSTFSWNVFNSGLNIGDPNNTGGYGTGDYYLAVGYDALAAGFAAAFGSSSYASGEGSFTHGKAITAIGNYSHAEGLGTIASGSYQHVQGRYNTQGDTTSLMIVGNGTTTNARKDAFKVRMSGSIVLPTTQSAAPSWTGADGEMVFATVTGAHYFYVWMAGAWRSGSLS